MIRVSVFMTAALLSACGGGSSSGSDPSPVPTPQGSISGVVFDSTVYNGTVEVLNYNGDILGTSDTNGSGHYQTQLTAESAPVLVRVEQGSYLEESTFTVISIDSGAGEALYSIDHYEAGHELNLSVTFFTTLATGYVEYLVHNQGLSVDVAITQAYAELDAWAGFDSRRTQPAVTYDVNNADSLLTDAIKAGYVAAGISELTRVVGVDTGAGEHSEYTSIGFIQMAYADIVADGVLDGLGLGGQLTFGNLTIEPDTYRTLLSTRLLQFVNSENNKIGLEFDDVLAYASHINLYAGAIFNYVPAIDIQDTSPTVSQFIPEDGATISGSYNAFALVDDPFGLLSVNYFIDDQWVAGAGNPYLPFRTIVTTNFANGEHEIRIEVENFFGNITSETHTITISN